MKFKWWYIVIWFVGFSLLFGGETWLIVLGIITLAVPFVLWFAVKPKKDEKTPGQTEIEHPVEDKINQNIERLQFAVVNTNGYQRTLEKVYKMQEGDADIWDMPQCVMYPRGDGFAVYLDSDRIGDADESKCKDIADLIKHGKLIGLSYEIQSQYHDDIDGLFFDAVITLTVKINEN